MSNPKNWIIALLLLIIAGQTWLLKDRFSSDEPQALTVSGVSLDSAMRTTLAVEFDQPVPDSVRAQAAPAVIEPAAEGQWVWANPYTLKFLAQTPLPLDMQYSLTLSPEVFPDKLLHAERSRLIRTGSFAVQELTDRKSVV